MIQLILTIIGSNYGLSLNIYQDEKRSCLITFDFEGSSRCPTTPYKNVIELLLHEVNKMPRLSEIEDKHTTQICLFLKFATEKWHLESLQSGKLRMNNLKKFIDMEKTEGKKGLGDLLEVSNVINLLNFKLIDPNTDVVILEGKSSRGVMTLNHCTPKQYFVW